MDFAARSLQECFRMLHSLVRQLILVWRQSMRLFGRFSSSSSGLSGRLLQDCLRIQRCAWFDSGYMFSVSLRGFSAELGSTADTCTASVYGACGRSSRSFPCWTLGDDFKIVSVFSAELGSTVDTCLASVYAAFWKNFTRFLREGVQFLVRFLSCPLLCTTCAGWSRQCRIAWRCRRFSSSPESADVPVATETDAFSAW